MPHWISEPHEVEELRLRLRTFALDLVPGAGHYLQEGRPEAVVAALRRMR